MLLLMSPATASAAAAAATATAPAPAAPVDAAPAAAALSASAITLMMMMLMMFPSSGMLRVLQTSALDAETSWHTHPDRCVFELYRGVSISWAGSEEPGMDVLRCLNPVHISGSY